MFERKKRQRKPSNRPSLDLPEIKGKKLLPDFIAESLCNDEPIIALYDPGKKAYVNGQLSYNVFIGMEINGLRPSMAMWVKKGPYLYDYRSMWYKDVPIYFLHRVLTSKPSTYLMLCNDDLKDAVAVYYDDRNYAKSQRYLPTDVTQEELDDYFNRYPKDRSMYVGLERVPKDTK